MSNLGLVSTKALRSVEVSFDTITGTVESIGSVVGIANTFVQEKANEFRATSKQREQEFRAKAIRRMATIKTMQIEAGKELLDIENNKENQKYLKRAEEALAELDKLLSE